MSSAQKSEHKGIFNWKKTIQTPTTSRNNSRSASKNNSRATSPRKPEVEKKSTQLPKMERMSRIRLQRNSIINVTNKVDNAVQTEKKSVVLPSEHPTPKDIKDIVDDITSPFKKVSELIENLDSSLNDFESVDVKSSTLSIGNESYVSAKSSSEFTDNSEYCGGRGGSLLDDCTQLLVRELVHSIQENVSDKIAMQKMKILLTQLNERIVLAGQMYKHQMKKMKDIQDTSFAELFMEKNEQITKLQIETEELKKENEFNSKASRELLMAKTELSRLKEILTQRDEEIYQLNYKSICARSQIELLQTEKNAKSQHFNANEKEIEHHFRTLKKILTSNRDLLKLLKLKQYK
ncbi:uncharacterized protein LOC116341792 [Contarinia nasturtii]|uniref:uncharacterized protein LOC116341792 n=1 Tax=Contarinia nasturtii TaxID=265458 RepID=UPI0012D3AAC0|nr:uncharacterized protein LOC116341792 [Contarinia nasturtii]